MYMYQAACVLCLSNLSTSSVLSEGLFSGGRNLESLIDHILTSDIPL